MSYQAWLILAACIAGLVFLVSLTSLPERVIEWRRQFWETDSDGMLGPPYKMNSFEEEGTDIQRDTTASLPDLGGLAPPFIGQSLPEDKPK